MTIAQIFEDSHVGRKSVWSKRGEEITKREMTAVQSIRPRQKIEVKKETDKS